MTEFSFLGGIALKHILFKNEYIQYIIYNIYIYIYNIIIYNNIFFFSLMITVYQKSFVICQKLSKSNLFAQL